MVVEAEITILFQIVLYLNLIYLIQQQIKWFHGFLLVDKQWGTVSQSVSQETEISFPINFKSNCYFIIGNDILDTTGNILTLFAFRNINTSVFIRNAVVFGKGGGITFGQVKFCYYLTMGK